MNQGRTIFAQLLEHAPHTAFRRCVERYGGNHRVRSFTCWDQFLCMAFELFFRWIKQHLRIKAFYGASANAVKTQVWIAISVYVLVAIIAKRLAVRRDLYTILQILSITLFEKTELLQALSHTDYTLPRDRSANQLQLFDF